MSASGSHSTHRSQRRPGSVSAAAEEFRQGDSSAAEHLHAFFWKRVAGLARQKLKQRAVSPRQASASDVAQDVLLAFFRALRAGRYEFFGGRDGLWAILARITDNRVKDLRRRQARRAARGLEMRGDSALPQAGQSSSPGLSQLVVESRLSPADEVEYAEACLAACESVLSRLNQQQRQIILGKAAGKTNAQLAKELGRTERTIELNLAAMRRSARVAEASDA
jgi:RNA polymerase sigma factor (sigma-70 family)